MNNQGNPMNKSIENKPIKNNPKKIEYPEHIKEEDGAYYIKYYKLQDNSLVEQDNSLVEQDNSLVEQDKSLVKLVEVKYPAYPSGRLKSQDDYKEIKKNFIDIYDIDEETLDGQNKLENFRRYNKGPLTGQLTDTISNFFSSNKKVDGRNSKFFSSNKKADGNRNFFSSNQNSVSVGGRRKSKKTKRKSLKRGRKTRRKSLKKRKRTKRKY